MAKSRVYKGIDIYKLILAMGIVALHASVKFLDTLGRLGVPFFTIVSSFLFFKKYLSLTKNARSFYLRKWSKRVLFLYIAWEFVYLPSIIRTMVSVFKNGINLKITTLWLFHYFFPATFIHGHTINSNGWGPSWYLLAILFGIPVCAKLFLLNKSKLSDLVIGLFMVMVEIYFILCSEFFNITKLSPLLIHTAVRLMPYFFIGYLCAKHLEKLLKINYIYILTLIFLILFLIENLLCYIYTNRPINEEIITTVPTCSLLFFSSLKCKPVIANTVYIREMSTFIYCFQWWPLFILNQLVKENLLPNYHFVIFMITSIACILGYLVYSKIRKQTKYNFWKYFV